MKDIIEITINEAKKFFESNCLTYKKTQFMCHAEGMITYHLNDINGGFFEITIEDNNNFFFRNQEVFDLLNSNSILYLNFKYHDANEEQIGSTYIYNIIN